MRVNELVNERVPEQLYVCRHLLNAEDFKEWAKEQGFHSILPNEHLHVTIAYSKEKIEWDESMAKENKITIRGGRRSIEQFGDAIVLRFDSNNLHERWAEIIDDLGASWDYPSYQPHVTITWKKGNLKLKNIKPYDGELVFGPEIFKGLDEDFKSTFKEIVLNEITAGVTLDDDDTIKNIATIDKDLRQKELFKDLPPISHKANREGFEEVGRLGSYIISSKEYNDSASKYDRLYIITTEKDTLVGYIILGQHFSFNDTDARTVKSIRIMENYLGNNIAIKMYQWLLRNECTLLFADDEQSRYAVSLWRKLYQTQGLDVFGTVYLDGEDKVWKISSENMFDEIYDYDDYKMGVAIKGTYE